MTQLTVALCVFMAVGVGVSAFLFSRYAGVAPIEDRPLTFYEVAYLSGGRSRVAEVALAYLVWAGLVEIRSGSGEIALVAAPSAAVELQPVEAALVATIPAEGGKPTMPLSTAREAATSLENGLDGYALTPLQRLTAALPAAGTAVVASVLAVWVGFSAGRWGLLTLIPLIGVIVILMTVLGNSRLTTAGRLALATETERVAVDLPTAEMGVTSLPIESGLYIVALHGRAAMTGALAPLRRVIR